MVLPGLEQSDITRHYPCNEWGAGEGNTIEKPILRNYLDWLLDSNMHSCAWQLNECMAAQASIFVPNKSH